MRPSSAALSVAEEGGMVHGVAEPAGGWALTGLIRRLAAVRDAHAEAGAPGIAYLLARRMPALQAEWLAFFAEAEGGPAEPVPFRWARPGDAPVLAQFGSPLEELRSRFARGDVCAYAEREGALAAHIWFATGRPYRHHGLTLHLGPQDAWAYDAEVAPRFRGRRLFPLLRQASFAALRRRGLRNGGWAVGRLNVASLRGSLRNGRRVATVVKLRLGPVGFVRVAETGGTARWRAFRREHDLTMPRAPRPSQPRPADRPGSA